VITKFATNQLDSFLRQVDDADAIIQYRNVVVKETNAGTKLIGRGVLDPQGEIISPVQVIRQPGLGDRIFALAATYTYCQKYPKMSVSFQATNHDNEWLTWLPFVKAGLDNKANTVVNFDNLPANIGDRTVAMADVFGVRLSSMQFPIDVPKNIMTLPDKPYYVFVPFASGRGPRSLPRNVIDTVLKKTDMSLVLIDAMPYETSSERVINLAAHINFPELFALIQGGAGVIGVDTGPVFAGLAMGKPTMILFSHVPAKNRIIVANNVVAYDAISRCAPCGDHIGVRPPCEFKEDVVVCMQHYTAEFLLYAMMEFAKNRGEE